MTIKIERDGARVYLVGDTYSLKDQIKAMGGHWDGDRRAWWVGAAKAAAAEALITTAATAGTDSVPKPEDLDKARVLAKAEYKGRIYYMLAKTRDGTRARLASLDGKVDFWAQTGEVRVTKTYAPREYRGRTEYTTLGSIRRFVERQSNPATRRGCCTECGAWGPVGESCSECGGEGSYA